MKDPIQDIPEKPEGLGELTSPSGQLREYGILGEEYQIQQCLKVIEMRAAGQTVHEVAAHFDVTERTIHNWQRKWHEDGILALARQLFLVPKAENISAAIDQVLDKFPSILLRMAKIANGEISATPRTQYEIAVWLHAEIVKPAMDSKAESGSAEAAYAESMAAMFDPINIDEGTTLLVPKQTKGAKRMQKRLEAIMKKNRGVGCPVAFTTLQEQVAESA